MTDSRELRDPALQSALRTARENESIWLKMHAEYATDSEALEQRANTARLRRLEVEWLEAILVAAEKQ
jgi:hypothetical protein